jgi:hypothetical protein
VQQASSGGGGVDWVQWLALAGGLAAVLTFSANRRDAARTDAAKIFVIVTLDQTAPPPEGQATFTEYQIVNKSDTPAASVAITAWDWGRRRVTWRLRGFGDWWTGKVIAGGVIPTMTPGGTSEGRFPGCEKPGPPGERHPLMLRFRDGLGREWVRWPDGKLTSLSPSVFQLVRLWRGY